MITRSKINKLTIAEAYDIFYMSRKVQNLSKRTLEYYDQNIKFFNEYYDTDNLCSSINEDVVDGYKEFLLEKDLSEQTVYTRIKAMRTILYFFMERRFMREFTIHEIKVGVKIKEIYTDEEIDILLKKPNDNDIHDYRTWILINFFYRYRMPIKYCS